MATNAAPGSRNSRWLIIAALVIAVLMGIGRLGAGLIDRSDSGSAPVTEPDCAAAVPWDQAGDHAGKEVTVRGPVAGTTYAENVEGQPTFLNIGLDHPDPDRFTVVIWGDERPAFDQRPEVQFAGQEICVAGEVQIYEGVAEIELSGPEAIEIASDS